MGSPLEEASMAKYEDYVKQDDELESEIQEASEQTQDRQSADNPTAFEMPDRFKEKTPEEIAATYLELEKAYSRQGNDLGRMRDTMDKYIETLQSDATINASSEATATEPVTIDDLYDDTEGAIQKAAARVYGDKIAELEAELAQTRLQTQVENLNERFGDIRKIAAQDDFQSWVMESPYRKRIAAAADGFDMDAAEELFGLWNERKGLTDLRAEAQRDSQLRDASLESSGAGVHQTEHRYSRTEIMDNRVRALHGDVEAQTWLKQNAEGIAIAYEEENLTD
jgi:hypothetical protein